MEMRNSLSTISPSDRDRNVIVYIPSHFTQPAWGFTSPRSVGDGSLFVEAHVSSKAAREYAKLVLEHCGQNPEEVYLQVK